MCLGDGRSQPVLDIVSKVRLEGKLKLRAIRGGSG